MRMLRAVLALVLGVTMLPFLAAPASAEVDIYVTEGTFTVNGRQWRTDCEPYSRTKRCRTEIWATVVTAVDGSFVTTNDWFFNNLTYDTSPRSLWATNPLGRTGQWTADDGRQWRTECDTPLTGQHGCRSFIFATVIETYTDDAGATAYRLVNKEVFNSMVRFEVPAAEPEPDPDPIPSTHLDPASIADQALRACLSEAVGVEPGEPLPKTSVAAVRELACDGVSSLAGLPALPNLEALFLVDGGLTAIGAVASLPKLKILDVSGNPIGSLAGVERLTALTGLGVRDTDVTTLAPVARLAKLEAVDVGGTAVSDLSPLAGLRQLEYLGVRGTNVRSVNALAGLRLKELDLRDNSISFVAPLASMTTLRDLYLAGNSIRDLSRLQPLHDLGCLIDIWPRR